VHEALPAPVAAGAVNAPATVSPDAGVPSVSGVTVLATGRFLSHEHNTSGTVRLLRLSDGRRILRLEDLDTSDGPALHVWLSDQPVLGGRSGWGVFDDGAHVDLGGLKGNRGDQNYPVPPEADLSRLTSVSVWCVRFHISFGAASLAPVT